LSIRLFQKEAEANPADKHLPLNHIGVDRLDASAGMLEPSISLLGGLWTIVLERFFSDCSSRMVTVASTMRGRAALMVRKTAHPK